MPISAQQIESLLPLAVQWAIGQENFALKSGEPLNEEELDFAIRIGVCSPKKVRLFKVGAMPIPTNPILRKAIDEAGLLLARAEGFTLQYGIFIRQDRWRNLSLVQHELAHTFQYERLGGIEHYLRQYLSERLNPNYPNSPLEQEARAITENIFKQTNAVLSLEERAVASLKERGETETVDSERVKSLAEQIRADFDKQADAARKRIKERVEF